MRDRRLRRPAASWTPERVERALALMRHRGPGPRRAPRFDTPDGRRVELLHTRLTIIDLDPRANQPFQRGDRWLAYNGELYNYVEVRERLEAARAAFRTTSDTEVLRRGARRATAGRRSTAARACGRSPPTTSATGDAAAVAATASARSRCTCCRDGRAASTSAPRPSSSFALLGRTPPVNRAPSAALPGQRLQGALQDRATRSSRGSRSCRPARRAARRARTAASGASATGDAAHRRPTTTMTFEEAVAGTRERLIRSVELRLRADVPLAFCMSGGVDSHVADLDRAQRVFDYDVHGFTIVNADERYEEQDMVDHAVAELGVRHTRDPARHARLPAAAARAGAPPRRAGLHDHLLRPLAADAGDRTSTATASRSAAPPPTSSSAATTTTTSPTCARCATTRRCTPLAARRGSEHVAAARAQPVPARTRTCFVDDPRLPRPHLPRRRRVRRLPAPTPFAEPFAERAFTRRPAAQPDAQRAVRTRRCR